ncbi:MAG: hypothetical protein MJB14_10195, partial [Spirochaetes bacterium]|nr:hypothetical protein [Spirochaetota bacterium]
RFEIYKNFFKKNYITNDQYGIEMIFTLENITQLYQKIDGIPDQTDTPLYMTFTPKLGYRFNKNLKLSGIIKLASKVEYSKELEQTISSFAAEMAIEGILTF